MFRISLNEGTFLYSEIYEAIQTVALNHHLDLAALLKNAELRNITGFQKKRYLN